MDAARIGIACLLLAGCGSEPDDTTPSGALQMFLDAMERSQWESGALEEAYRLLSPAAREQLRVRAETATSLSGRTFEPWEMIAQGRYGLRFAPRRSGGMIERVEGDTAIVVVRGSREGQVAEVPMVLEDGRWRVKLELPEVGAATRGR